MSVYTFFGHRDAPFSIQRKLEEVLIDLIENKEVTVFYVGNQGSFDFLVNKSLRKLKEIYPHIKPFAVLAYMPRNKKEYEQDLFLESIYPENLERVPLKFAISKQNAWMIDRSDYVVTYITRVVGGAYQFAELSEKRKKKMINIADMVK